MNLAIFGDPYYVGMISHNAHYVYRNCGTVYVTDTMIAKDGYDGFSGAVSIESIINNIDAIDEVLTFYRENSIPLPIKQLLNRTTKNIPIMNVNSTKIYKTFLKKNYDSILLKCRPAILSISMGKAAQQYHTEMLINRYFRKMNFAHCKMKLHYPVG